MLIDKVAKKLAKIKEAHFPQQVEFPPMKNQEFTDLLPLHRHFFDFVNNLHDFLESRGDINRIYEELLIPEFQDLDILNQYPFYQRLVYYMVQYKLPPLFKAYRIEDKKVKKW
jgi:hypothetical protein